MSKSGDYTLSEIEKRNDMIAELVEALKDAHPYITGGLRQRIGELIVRVEGK